MAWVPSSTGNPSHREYRTAGVCASGLFHPQGESVPGRICEPHELGIGPGLAMRYWFGETAHRAFPRYLDLSVQYRWRLTDAQRGGGLFGLVTLSF